MENYKGFYKIGQDGFSLTSAYFYNPETKECFSKIVWDIDDDRLYCDEDLQELRYLPMDYEMEKLWKRENCVVQDGDTVKVFKGRKVPIGTVAKVEKISPYYDKYKRWCCDYAYLDNGMRTNVNNCKLLDDNGEELEKVKHISVEYSDVKNR